MDLSLSTLLSLARFTVQNPREGARMVMRANLPMTARWVALALMAVASAILAHLAFALMPVEAQQAMAGAMASTLIHGPWPEFFAEDESESVEAVFENLVRFTVAGMNARASNHDPEAEK